jgi:hypothetical protein
LKQQKSSVMLSLHPVAAAWPMHKTRTISRPSYESTKHLSTRNLSITESCSNSADCVKCTPNPFSASLKTFCFISVRICEREQCSLMVGTVFSIYTLCYRHYLLQANILGNMVIWQGG